MSLPRHALSALVLFVAMPLCGVGVAKAGLGNVMQASGSLVRAQSETSLLKMEERKRLRVQLPDASGLDALSARVESDGGEEDVTLVETDAWLHGTATLEALPEIDAALTLTLYDTGSAALMTFSGTIGADGTVALSPDLRSAVTGECASRLGCTVEEIEERDIRLSAADPTWYVSHAADHGARVMTFDLAGADTYAIAYAEITVTERTGWEVEDECLDDRSGTLVCGDTSHFRTTTTEVEWDAVGSVWEADLGLEHAGPVDVKVKVRGADGETLDNLKVALGSPWRDDGEGVSALATDGDPLTSVALVQHFGTDRFAGGHVRTPRMVVVSEGWTAGGAIPTHAEVELSGGGTITIPVNSYQRSLRRKKYLASLKADSVSGTDGVGSGELDERTITITGAAATFEGISLTDLATPVCDAGTCVELGQDASGFALSVTTYGTDATALPDEDKLVVTTYDKGGTKLSSEEVLVEYDDAIAAVFANEVSFTEDPIGLELSGRVSLLAAADRRGRQSTLARGTFHARLSRDGDGDLALAGADIDGLDSRGDLLVAGASVAIESVKDEDGDGALDGPAAVQASTNTDNIRTWAVLVNSFSSSPK